MLFAMERTMITTILVNTPSLVEYNMLNGELAIIHRFSKIMADINVRGIKARVLLVVKLQEKEWEIATTTPDLNRRRSEKVRDLILPRTRRESSNTYSYTVP